MAKVGHSFTSVDGFTNCERAFYYKYLERRPEPIGVDLSVGNYFHAVIAGLLRGPVDARQVLAQVKAAERQWAQDVTDEQLAAEALEVGRLLTVSVFPHVKPIMVEAWAPPDSPYRAKLDLLSYWTPIVGPDGVPIGHAEEPCVIDWKVRKGAPKRRENTQLALYCLAAGVKHAGFCELGRDGRPPRLTMVRFHDNDLSRWKEYFDGQFKAMDSRGPSIDAYKFAAPGNGLCSPKWCPHWIYCANGENRK
jgi:hypothetical protein